MSAYQYIYIYVHKRKTKKNATIVATVPFGTVATVQNLNKRVKKKKKKTHETTIAATVLHSEIRWVHSVEEL